MTNENLKEILEEHAKWLNGKGGKRADLCGADLRSADLRYANLRYATLSGADLCEAHLYGADLRSAILSKTNLEHANLCEATLISADLRYADLRGADLEHVDLREAHLDYAILRNADLCGADLRSADLRSAILSGADLCGADLCGAELINPISCPTDGEFIGWKKVDDYIIKLKILEDSRRCSATTNKCRCDKALVLAIQNLDGTDSGLSMIINNRYSDNCVYKIGEIVYPDSFDNDRWNECSHGIHFFTDRESAVKWQW